jgi:8-oxo-dGTP pyrophosphatase MutT (NUDIX family)
MTVETITKQTYVGAGIILVQTETGGEKKYLLLKGRVGGVWSFPKGHPESCDKQAPLRTAVRETFEETGLVAGQDYTILGNSIRFGKRPYWVGVVRSPCSIKVNQKEHTEAVWMTWEEVVALQSTNTDVRCWIKKSRGANGEFMRLLSYLEQTETQDMHLTV